MEMDTITPTPPSPTKDMKEMKPEETFADAEAGSTEVLPSSTHRGLKPRHTVMIALGGSVGTGVFIGSAAALARGGPGFLLLCYLLVSILTYFIITAAVEVASYLPVAGGTMSFYAGRNVSPSLKVALSYLYFYSLGILVPYEITAAGLLIDYWNSPVNIAVWISILIVVIVGLNLMPVAVYGETEFWFASIKIIMLCGFFIMTIVIFFGGGPKGDGVLGFHYWNSPGATNTWLASGDRGRFIAFLEVLVLSSFPFLFAPELVIATGGEMKNPRRNLPKAGRSMFVRLMFFYVASIIAIGIICPYDDPQLVDSSGGAKTSAFVVGAVNAGIKAVPSIINAVVITSGWSAANSFLYMSSRSLYSMALAGDAPAIFKRCNRHGNPYMAVLGASIFSALAYLRCGSSGSQVFNYFVNITNTAGFISWICICIIYLRFRKACQVQNLPESSLPFHSALQPYGAWIALVFFVFLTLVNGFDVFFPGHWNTATFITAYIGIPIFFAIYFGHKIFHRDDPWLINAEDIDLHTGLDVILADEEEEPQNQTFKEKTVEFFQ